MLVLSRQRDETIMIGDEIEITVVDIRGDKVRLGIEAPPRIAVHRKEVYEAIKCENERAARAADGEFEAIDRTLSPGPQRTRNQADNGLKETPALSPRVAQPKSSATPGGRRRA